MTTAAPQDAGWDPKVPTTYELTTTELDDENVQPPQWYANAAKYEWNEEYGDGVGPRVEELEQELFRDTTRTNEGEFLANLNAYSVTLEGPTQIAPVARFEDAGLHPVMLDTIKLCKYSKTMPVQAYCIPAVLSGKDVMAVAQTGSGKTAAYLVPILSKLMGKAKKLAAARPNPARYNPDTDKTRAEPLVLIVCPTRELAIQIFDEARRMCYRTMLRPSVVYGGGPRRQQLEDLQRGCDVLIGTPGRLKDFVITEPRWLSLRRLKFTVLDEADEMLDESWQETLGPVLNDGTAGEDGGRQFLMFSATFSREARVLAKEYLAEDYIRIRVGRSGSAHRNIQQTVMWVEEDLKQTALMDLLLSLPPARTMVFVATTSRVDIIDDFLHNAEFPVTSIHSQRTQPEREDAIRAFRTGRCPILVCTSVAARGLDVKNVMHIISVDLPSTDHGGITDYVHRIGRTARIGNQGLATSFYNDRNSDIAPDLVKILLESSQEVPDFLESFKPEGDLKWEEDESDAEGEDEAGDQSNGADAGWGGQVASPAPDSSW